MPDHNEFTQLVGSALAGNRKAARVLHRRLRPAMLSAARARTRSEADADDIVQAAWHRLLARDGRTLRAYDPRRSSPEGFAYMVARRVRLPASPTFEVLHDETSVGPSPAALVHARLDAERVSRRLRVCLSALHRQVYVLAFEQELGNNEIAELIHRPVQDVANAKFRIRGRAKKLIGDRG